MKQNIFYRFFRFSEDPHESHLQSWPTLSRPLQRHFNEIDTFISTRPPNILSIEKEIAIIPLEKVHLISNLSLIDIYINILPPPVTIPHSLISRYLTQAEALRVFKDLNIRQRDPHYIVIL